VMVRNKETQVFVRVRADTTLEDKEPRKANGLVSRAVVRMSIPHLSGIVMALKDVAGGNEGC
jgi:hypothetical protein